MWGRANFADVVLHIFSVRPIGRRRMTNRSPRLVDGVRLHRAFGYFNLAQLGSG